MFRDGNDLSSIIDRWPPSKWRQFIDHPAHFLARLLYRWHLAWLSADAAGPRSRSPMPLVAVCISDTHNRTSPLPEGDILIHAGDLTQGGSTEELQRTLDWLNAQPHAHKIVIAGNHDTCLDPDFPTQGRFGKSDQARQGLPYTSAATTSTTTTTATTVIDSVASVFPSSASSGLDWGSIVYLQDTSSTIQVRGRRVRVFGSPWTPRQGNWAFQYARGTDIWRRRIPEGTDILVTHGPPLGHLDTDGGHGCGSLLDAVWSMQTKPLLHVFGHIHAGYGQETVEFDSVQRAYEEVVKARVGFWWLCVMLYHSGWLRLTALVSGLIATPVPEANKTSRPRTIFVNAAQIGGFRDNLSRPPVTVII